MTNYNIKFRQVVRNTYATNYSCLISTLISIDASQLHVISTMKYFKNHFKINLSYLIFFLFFNRKVL